MASKQKQNIKNSKTDNKEQQKKNILYIYENPIYNQLLPRASVMYISLLIQLLFEFEFDHSERRQSIILLIIVCFIACKMFNVIYGGFEWFQLVWGGGGVAKHDFV